MIVFRLGLMVAIVTTVGIIQAARQEPAEQPTFVAGVDLVRVDLYATREGALVDDLRPEEVELYEDGTRQELESLELVRISAREVGTPATASGQPDADARSRIIVLFFDASVSDPRLTRERVIAPAWPLFQSTLGPSDIVGLATRETEPASIDYRRGELVTRDQLDRFWERIAGDRERDPKERLYALCYPGPDSPAGEMAARLQEERTFDALEGLAAHLATVGHGRKVVLLITGGWRLFTRSDILQTYRPPSMPLVFPPLGGGRGGGIGAITEAGVIDDAAMSRMFRECEQDRFRLANLDHRNRLNEIAERANSGNVSFYPVSPGGVGAMSLERQMDLRALAADTDGMAVVNSDDIAGGIRRMLSDTSAYYLLGYVSSNPAPDGRFRRISVRVTRPGVQVRARSGYRASRPEDPVAPAPVPPIDPRRRAVAEAVEALAIATEDEPLRLRASSWLRAGPGRQPAGVFWVAGELDARLRNDAARQAVTARISVSGPDGASRISSIIPIARDSAAFTVRVPEDTTKTVGPGAYQFLVSFVDDASAVIESASGVVTIQSQPSSIGEPVLWRRGRGARAPYATTADPRYRRTDTLRLAFPAAHGGTPSAQVLDRTGAPLAIPATITTREAESPDFEWIVVDLALAPFAPGEYAVELTSGADRRVGAFAVLP